MRVYSLSRILIRPGRRTTFGLNASDTAVGRAVLRADHSDPRGAIRRSRGMGLAPDWRISHVGVNPVRHKRVTRPLDHSGWTRRSGGESPRVRGAGRTAAELATWFSERRQHSSVTRAPKVEGCHKARGAPASCNRAPRSGPLGHCPRTGCSCQRAPPRSVGQLALASCARWRRHQNLPCDGH